MADKVKVDIRKDIYDRIAKRVEVTEFETVGEYVDYVLEEVLSQVEEEEEEQVYSKEDEDKVKEKLRSLGYLD